ncbi:MAG: energy transducer TonB [Flavobacteriaceae bacterium]
MKTPLSILMLIFLGINLAHGGTKLSIEDTVIKIVHDTESLVYYKSRRSSDLKNWNPTWMPEFLGTGTEQSILTLYPTTTLEKLNFFVQVEKGDPFQAFDPDDHPPIPILKYAPAYPTDLFEQGIEGTVTALFVVSKEGKVSNIEIESTPDARFNDAVTFVLKFWRFYPAEINGEKVNVRVRLPIPFKIMK